jgi:tRNA threonylcarbamoyladenosine biosynthesis protein TsaE
VTALELSVATAEAMRALGEALGRAAVAGDRFLLEGDFGAGKTTFVQGLARGLDVIASVGSPTFVIETVYRGRLVLYHVDLYRLDRIEAELLEQLEEHLFADGVSAVEWAERLPSDLREGATLLSLHADGDVRRVTIDGADERLRRAAGGA